MNQLKNIFNKIFSNNKVEEHWFSSQLDDRHYNFNDDIILSLSFAAVISFVENHMDQFDWEENKEDKKARIKILEIYDIIKLGIPRLIQDKKDVIRQNGTIDKDRDNGIMLKKINQKIKKLESRALSMIQEVREYVIFN